MNSKVHIAVTLFLAFFALQARAQFGHVVVHADPRLAVLLTKNPIAAPPPTPVPNAETKSKPKGAGEKTESPNKEEHHFIPQSTHRDGRVLYAGKGFRVQIYNGYDRDKAMRVRTDFMRSNPDTRAYFMYASPFFRIKVGDYRTREQAASMLRAVKGDYETPAMIVPDKVMVHEN